MRIKLFSPILLMLVVVLLLKVTAVVRDIEREMYGDDFVSSSLVDVSHAYAAPVERDSVSDVQNSEDPVVSHQQKGISEAQLYDRDFLSKDVNNAELKLLRALSERRKELENNDKELRVREQLLKAMEEKIEHKMDELRSLQTRVDSVLKEYDQKESNKIVTLVKIYENMKPSQAAKIFDELEMRILTRITSSMKESKIAPIIAYMNPSRARELSIELAKEEVIER